MITKSPMVVAKQNLCASLSQSEWKSYLGLMKQWFKGIITKETFDAEARSLCKDRRSLHHHNQLLLALFVSCNSFSGGSGGTPSAPSPAPSVIDDAKKAGGVSATIGAASNAASPASSSSVGAKAKDNAKGKKLKKPKSKKISFHNNFTPTNPLAYAVQMVSKSPEEERGIALTSRTRTLPDASMVHGRLLVGAWDAGLDAVQENAVHLLCNAVEMHMREILVAMIKNRKAYQLRDGRFPTHFGSEQSNGFARNSSKALPSLQRRSSTSAELDEDDVACHFAQSAAPAVKRRRTPLTLMHLRDALTRHRSCIASHTVYAINMERILNAFDHPTREDEEQGEQIMKERGRKKETEEYNALVKNW